MKKKTKRTMRLDTYVMKDMLIVESMSYTAEISPDYDPEKLSKAIGPLGKVKSTTKELPRN